NAIFGERMSLNSAYNFTDEIPGSVFIGTPVEVRKDSMVTISEDRPLALNAVEKKTYSNVDSLNNVRLFNTILSLGNLFANGYHSIGKVELGPLEYAYQPNNLEGHRFRVG